MLQADKVLKGKNRGSTGDVPAMRNQILNKAHPGTPKSSGSRGWLYEGKKGPGTEKAPHIDIESARGCREAEKHAS
jgi:hypothetical protein